jgi:hypothetical protein
MLLIILNVSSYTSPSPSAFERPFDFCGFTAFAGLQSNLIHLQPLRVLQLFSQRLSIIIPAW